MKHLAILSATIISVFFTSCIFSPSIKGDGNVVEEIRNTGDFDEIKVSRGMNVYISQGDQTKVTVKADGNLLDVIETETVGDVLEISCKANIKKATVKKIFVTTPNLVGVKASAGSNVFSETTINTKELEISASAGSNIKLKLNANSTDVSASAGSNISREGKVDRFYGKASSGSNIKAEKLSSKNSEAKTSSGANIWITFTKNLTGNASSGGNIFYYGNPEKININRSSGGNVINKTN
jgi:hypothetical protein